MEWNDKGLILATRKHGETSVILEAMTENHGRCLGLVRGGRSSRMRPVLQAGNSVHLTWRARLEEHLGAWQVEADKLRAASLMQIPLGIYGAQMLASHLRLLPERDPHPGLYHAALVVLDHFDDAERAGRLMIRFELALLEELGFGLELSSCASTGEARRLFWVSPRTGRAVGEEAGRPYADRLLALPQFLLEEPRREPVPLPADPQADGAAVLRAGFALAAHFLERNVYIPRGIRPPDVRVGFAARVLAAFEDTENQTR